MNRRGLFTFAFALVWAARAGASDFDLAAATNQVGLDLYRQLAANAPGRNLALSPYSIESALALAYAGADGVTRREMASVLHFPGDDQALRAAFALQRDSLDRIAAESGWQHEEREPQGGYGHLIEWHAANRLFGQEGYPFRGAFLGLLQDGYAAPLEPLDFIRHADEARITINAWVLEQTRGRIRDLIPYRGVDPTSRLVLVNALYLKAPWEHPFESRATTDLPFYSREGKSGPVPTMRRTGPIDYLKGDGFTALALPYRRSALQMLIVLPDDRDGLDGLLARLTPASIRAYAHLGRPQLVALHLPKFRLEGSTIDLGQNLQALGLKTAFDHPRGSANFDRAAPRRPDDYLFISKVYHQTFIAVDEAGTEAAAATAGSMGFGMARPLDPPKPIEVRVDHPFFFAIQDRATGVCLFFGSITDPR